MSSSYFPLRWESTDDQWWFASPIDWAVANGHYDLVRELLRIDPNLLIKLTSLRRIRRLETVWDDESRFIGVASCRAHIAKNLLIECETKDGKNSLIRAGYGGWLLYTASSSGDLGFVQELLERDPLLVFGEGEFGVTDILYAAARSKNSDVFRVLFDYIMSPRCSPSLYEDSNGGFSIFTWEMMNRAVHSAARGGNLEILKELTVGCSDILAYRDVQGSTILHAASGRGQVEVVKDLAQSIEIVTSRDNQGNTALHVAAYRGHVSVVDILIHAYPPSSSMKNNGGDTFLHMAVAGFRTPSFRRLDRQIELMKKLVFGRIIDMKGIINIRNNHGRTALHVALIGNIHCNLVELLMIVPEIDLNIRDEDGFTPLDILRQHPRSASSEILMKQIISSGGLPHSWDHRARKAMVSHLKMQVSCTSPGTYFRIPDSELFSYTCVEDRGSTRSSYSSSNKSRNNHFDASDTNHFPLFVKGSNSVNLAAKRLKILLGWPSLNEKKLRGGGNSFKKLEDEEESLESNKKSNDLEENLTPLRERFTKPSSLPNSKRVLSIRVPSSSPKHKEKLTYDPINDTTRRIPQFSHPNQSPSNSLSTPLNHSPESVDQHDEITMESDTNTIPSSISSVNGGIQKISKKAHTPRRGLMRKYLCFGSRGLSCKDPVGKRTRRAYSYKRAVLLKA